MTLASGEKVGYEEGKNCRMCANLKMKTNPYCDAYTRYQAWSGWVPAGHVANFLGSLSRVDRLYPGVHISELERKSEKDYFEITSIPRPVNTDYFEMGAVLSAVNQASGSFNMLELGAGTGPWTASAARAAASRGVKSRFFIAVEAEPTRSEWLQENLKINGILRTESRIRRAVVFPSSEKGKQVYFPVGAPLFAGHTAQPSLKELDASQRKRRVEYVGRIEEAALEAAPVVSLKELLQERIDLIFDLAHVDIQGVEDRVVEDAAKIMQTNLRSIAIGTHSASVEKSLEQTFTQLGWECVFSFGTNSAFAVDGIEVSTKGLDGFQHWINPRLYGVKTSLASRAVRRALSPLRRANLGRLLLKRP